jgi:hypothetical protein
VHSLTAHATKLAAACLLVATWVFVAACGRVAVDTDSSRKPASVATAPSAASQGAPAAPTAGAIAELHQRRDLDAEQVVSVEGVLKEFSVCQDCPKDAACAPCAAMFLLGTRLDSPAEATVLFINSSTDMTDVFHVGKRYVFSGTLREWRDPSAGHPTFVNFNYVSHRALQ